MVFVRTITRFMEHLRISYQRQDMSRVQSCTERINKHDAKVNAFIYRNEDEALKKAREIEQRISNGKSRSDIDGMVIAIKDNIHVAGLPNSAGTPALKRFIPKENAPIVEKLLSAGAICIGKVNMHEMAFGITSYNYTFYKEEVGVRNAFDHSKIAGGSSGGSAVAVAMDMCDISLGTDTGGSVRIPAALNGVVGFRPSMHRYSSEGITPISHTRDTAGILAKSVQDIQRVDQIITDHNNLNASSKLESIVLGYDESQCLVHCSDDMIAAWKMMLERLKNDKRVTLVEISMKNVYDLDHQVSGAIVAHEAYHDLAAYLERYNTGVTVEELVEQIASPDVKEIYNKMAFADNKAPYEDAMTNIRPQLIAEYEAVFINNSLDAVIAPCTPIPAIDATRESVFSDSVVSSTMDELRAKSWFSIYTQNTDICTCVGSPSITIPILPNDRLPLGFMLDGRIDYDLHLLSVAEVVESIM